MNTPAESLPQTRSRMSLELFLVVALPLAAVLIASTLAYMAYTHGFTSLPEAAAVHAH